MGRMKNHVIAKAVKRMGGVAYVSAKLNVSRAYIYMLMNGERKLSKRIAPLLGLEVTRKITVRVKP